MTILRWIWWAGKPVFGAICFGYAIAFAGWGLSFWSKPQPDALLTCLAFFGAAVQCFREAISELTQN